MAWCLMALSHYLNKCWLLISELLWFTWEQISAQATILHIYRESLKILLKLLSHHPQREIWIRFELRKWHCIFCPSYVIYGIPIVCIGKKYDHVIVQQYQTAASAYCLASVTERLARTPWNDWNCCICLDIFSLSVILHGLRLYFHTWNFMIIGKCYTGIILCMCPANEKWRYNVTPFLIGWGHIRNDLWLLKDHTYSRLFGYVKIIARSLPFSRDHSVYVPSQWETTLQCNVVSHWPVTYTKLSMCPANERLCYIVTSSLIGCVHAQNDPCFMISYQTINIMDTTHCLCNKPTGLEMAM